MSMGDYLPKPNQVQKTDQAPIPGTDWHLKYGGAKSSLVPAFWMRLRFLVKKKIYIYIYETGEEEGVHF